MAILAKAPLAGRVKTRLIPALGAERAARLHAELLTDTLDIACRATASANITLWTALDHRHPLFLELASRFGVRLRPQPEGDLGERMFQALNAMSVRGLLIGSDCPVLTPELLKRCHQALQDHDAVFLPAEDGGYALVGTQRADKRLFENIAWGSARVMAETRRCADELGWHIACPATVWDLDRPEDLERYHRLKR